MSAAPTARDRTRGPLRRRRTAPTRRTTSAPGVERVALLIGQLGLGGAEKQIVLLARELSRRGVATDLLVLGHSGPRAAELGDADVRVVELGLRSRPVTIPMLARNLRALARLVHHLLRTRPQVLHAYLFTSYVVAAPAGRLARVPVIVAGRRSLGAFKEGRRWALTFERLATRWTDAVVANAEAVVADTRMRESLPAAKVHLIRNALPEAELAAAPEPAEVPSALPVVVCLANLSARKGHRHLLDAAALLRERGRECTLVLVGDGDERLALGHQAARLGLDVRFAGRCTDGRRYLHRADVVVLPSLEEGCSNAVLEAMAAGRPVVGTAVGGTPELLDGRGVLVPPGDPEALAEGLARVLDDPELAARLGADARVWVRTECTTDALAERHLALYARLLARRCAG